MGTQPIHGPIWWPASNIVASLNRDDDEIPDKPSSVPSVPWKEHVGSMTSSLRNFILAYMAVHWMYDSSMQYPAYGDAKEFRVAWIMPIVMRNIVGKRKYTMQGHA